MKNKFVYLSGGLALLAVAVVLIIQAQGPIAQQERKFKVAATIFPLADIAANIGGERLEVVNVLPPGASPHTFDLTPSQIKDLQNARILFVVGNGLDNWAAGISESVEGLEIYEIGEGVSLQHFKFEHSHEGEHEDHDEEANEGHNDEGSEARHHEHGTLDPHYWLSVENGKIIAENIAQKLSENDPVNKEYYAENLRAYEQALDSAKIEIEKDLAGLSAKKLIVFHDSWNYFAGEFGLEIAGVFASSPGKEPTPQYLEELHETAKAHNIKAVFSEPQLSPETIRPFVEDLGLKFYVMDPLGGVGERDSYINLLIYNAETISKALR